MHCKVHEMTHEQINQILFNATLTNTYMTDDDLVICFMVEPSCDKEDTFIIQIKSVDAIFENDKLIDSFQMKLSDAEVLSYEIEEQSLTLVIQWFEFDSRKSLQDVYVFKGKSILVNM